ncbi:MULTISPECIES: sigma-70 family RNA polymerase sigma factor [Kitasatospora]|uniref:RNA polymerase sigma factor 70 region 4 type 2 domain-containing protein n=1 Tax=Kitasatospora cystarginea TaxID=58350 RepID=A0ABN3DFG0_9ACTN
MNENDWAVRPSRPRLTFEAFCETHERAWTGFARARLRDGADAARAVATMKDHLWSHWDLALRQAVPACYAWMLIKEHVADALADAVLKEARLPPESTVPDWARVVRHFADQARISLESLEEREDLYEAIRRLPERQHDVVVLRYLLGLQDARIADYLGITEANVRSTASQAVKRLARVLGREAGWGEVR